MEIVKFGSKPFHDNQSDVVVWGGSAGEVGECGFNLVTESGRGLGDILGDDLFEALHTEFVLCEVISFRDAIGIDDEHVARIKLSTAEVILCEWHNAQRQSARPEQFNRTVGPTYERRIMPGVDKRKDAGGWFEFGCKKCNESVRRSVLG